MSFRVVMQRVGAYWQKRLVRILVAALVLAGAIVLQYRLANIPLPVQVEKTSPPYTPATAALINDEELIIDKPSQSAAANPANDNPPGVLVSGLVKEFVAVDAHFDSAQLSDTLMARLQRDPENKALQTKGPQQIDYATEETQPENRDQSKVEKKPCRTLVSVTLKDRAKMPAELHFFQIKGLPGTDHFRYFRMKAVGSDLVVQVITRNLAGDLDAPGCSKTLSVGEWSHAVTGPVPIDIFVPDGANFQFSFTPLSEKTKWSGPGEVFEPFLLEASPLGVHSVRKITREGSSSASQAFSAASVEGAPLLSLKHFVVGADELRLDFSGQAMVQENGKSAVTFDLWQFAKKYTLLAGLLAMLDAALLGWISRVAFGSKRRERKTKRTTSRGKKKQKSSSDQA
jgi:hypothetical protein